MKTALELVLFGLIHIMPLLSGGMSATEWLLAWALSGATGASLASHWYDQCEVLISLFGDD